VLELALSPIETIIILSLLFFLRLLGKSLLLRL
jgi:hypothetical protein